MRRVRVFPATEISAQPLHSFGGSAALLQSALSRLEQESQFRKWVGNRGAVKQKGERFYPLPGAILLLGCA